MWGGREGRCCYLDDSVGERRKRRVKLRKRNIDRERGKRRRIKERTGKESDSNEGGGGSEIKGCSAVEEGNST